MEKECNDLYSKYRSRNEETAAAIVFYVGKAKQRQNFLYFCRCDVSLYFIKHIVIILSSLGLQFYYSLLSVGVGFCLPFFLRWTAKLALNI